MARTFAFLLALLVAAVTAHAAGADNRPSPRIYHSMVSLNDGRLLMLGGVSKHGFGPMDLRDTWAYAPSLKTWEYSSELTPGDLVGAAYDRQSDRVIVLNYAGETWAFNPSMNEWENRNPADAPSGRCGHGLAYDAQSDRTVLFGGFKCTDISDPLLDDTWSYDFESNTWTRHEPELSPPPRIYHSMVYHEQADRVVMWGGRAVDPRVWTFDLDEQEWAALEQPQRPEGIRAYNSVAYDPSTNLIFSFGGLVLDEPLSNEGQLLDETWTFDLNGNLWTLHEPENSPTARSHHSMALDRLGRLIVYGGEVGSPYSNMMSSQVWALDPSTVTWTLDSE